MITSEEYDRVMELALNMSYARARWYAQDQMIGYGPSLREREKDLQICRDEFVEYLYTLRDKNDKN